MMQNPRYEGLCVNLTLFTLKLGKTNGHLARALNNECRLQKIGVRYVIKKTRCLYD